MKLLAILAAGGILLSACGKEEPQPAPETVEIETTAPETESGTGSAQESEPEEPVEEEPEEPPLYTYDGEYLLFGNYEQDGNTGNGPEPIEWIVLDQNENGTLLLSRYILAAQPFNTEEKEISWEDSSLRAWMNNDFLQEAFTEEEQALIRDTTLENPDNSFYNQGFGGNDTVDKVFCLSVDDIEKYFEYNYWDEANCIGHSQQLMALPTPYAEENGVRPKLITSGDFHTIYERDGYTDEIVGMETCYWWLRTVGSTSGFYCVADYGGYAGPNHFYRVSYDDFGVRPAMYVDVDIDL